jgi:hypothetical protein
VGTLVEHFLIGIELLMGDPGEIGAFEEVVADAVVLALAGGAFLRAVGVAEEDRELKVGREDLLLGHFLALAIGQALAQDAGQGREFTLERLAHAGDALCGRWQRKV